MDFHKPAQNSEEHYELLLKRGLVIKDKEEFYHYLDHIGYYRLTGYMYPFQAKDGSHKFKPGTDFNSIVNHYIFDRKLRLLLLDAILFEIVALIMVGFGIDVYP